MVHGLVPFQYVVSKIVQYLFLLHIYFSESSLSFNGSTLQSDTDSTFGSSFAVDGSKKEMSNHSIFYQLSS